MSGAILRQQFLRINLWSIRVKHKILLRKIFEILGDKVTYAWIGPRTFAKYCAENKYQSCFSKVKTFKIQEKVISYELFRTT